MNEFKLAYVRMKCLAHTNLLDPQQQDILHVESLQLHNRSDSDIVQLNLNQKLLVLKITKRFF